MAVPHHHHHQGDPPSCSEPRQGPWKWQCYRRPSLHKRKMDPTCVPSQVPPARLVLKRTRPASADLQIGMSEAGEKRIVDAKCSMADLCNEDKQQISDLLQKVLRLTEDNEHACREAAAEKATSVALAQQNRTLLEEVATLKSKLSHSLQLLRAYQAWAKDTHKSPSKISAEHVLLEEPPLAEASASATQLKPVSSKPCSSHLPLCEFFPNLGDHLIEDDISCLFARR